MIKGNCLCGKIEIEIKEEPKTFGACHCLSCRKWTGGVFMSVSGGKALKFSNEDLVGRYSSSEWAERGFCKVCGSNLFFRMKKSDHYFLMLGLFGDDIKPKFEDQHYIDEKPSNYCFSNETKNTTKKEMKKMLQEFLSS